LPQPIRIIGAGLAGSEAAWQIVRAGLPVILYEMRPVRQTAAHRTDHLAELVCSNSLKSDQGPSASWLLKEELRRLDSLLIRIADRARVPGGHALTVDREVFAAEVTQTIESEPLIELRREEMTTISGDAITIVATGPLTSDAMAADVARLTGSDRLYFYDSISPIVDAATIDMSIAFRASRYGKSLDGTDDYLNCPLDRDQYERFVDALLAANIVESHIADDTPFFEACLPIEEIARRGRDTLRFGPMKPMGLVDPRTGHRPYAVVQLRQENLRAESYNLVGFQNHLKFGEQARILRMIPGLEHAEFFRFGQIHRNTLHQRPGSFDCVSAIARPAEDPVRRPDFGRRRLRRINRYGFDRGPERGGPGFERSPAPAPERDGAGIALPLHFVRRSHQLPAGQYRLRPVPTVG